MKAILLKEGRKVVDLDPHERILISHGADGEFQFYAPAYADMSHENMYKDKEIEWLEYQGG